jgi:hypothetical protein
VVAQSANSAAPTGQVYIFSGDNLLTSGTIVNGKGSAIFYADGAGDFPIRAQYQGDSNFAASLSANTLKFSVPQLTPAITFTTSGAYALPNSQVSLNFTGTGVMINAYIQQDPTGTVTFSDSVGGAAAQVLGTFPINFVNGMTGGYSGRFTLPAGSNVITATYSGNANFVAASLASTILVGQPGFSLTTAQDAVVVNAGAPSTVSLSLSPTLGFTGVATLSCGSGVPAGSTCTFAPAAITFGSTQATTLTVTTPAASPSMTASAAVTGGWKMLGGATFAGALLMLLPRRRKLASLLALLLAVAVPFTGCGGSDQPKVTLLSVSSSSIKAASAASVTLTAKLDALSSAPTGTVTFYDGTTAIGAAVSITGGTATLQTTSLAVGAHSITAVYSGDAKDVGSTSAAIMEVITGTTTLQVNATSGTLVQTVAIPLTLN